MTAFEIYKLSQVYGSDFALESIVEVPVLNERTNLMCGIKAEVSYSTWGEHGLDDEPSWLCQVEIVDLEEILEFFPNATVDKF